MYVWVVASDDTVEQRSVEATLIDSDVAVVTKGIFAGEHVVVNGQYRLQAGTKVDAKSQRAEGAPGKPS
jgi:multidrug efflux system membrane fusion protein